MSMTLSVSKTFVLTTGPKDKTWKIGDSGEELKETLVAKYLGIEISLQGRNLIKPRESNMIGGARTYAHTIMGCTRSGLDRALTAFRLWESCGILGFLYGTEAMLISKSTVKELEKIQHMVGSFILQLPRSSSQVMGWMEAGLQPIQQRLDTRTVLYAHSLMTGKKDQLTKAVLSTTLADAADPWTKSVNTILEKVGIHDLGGSSRRAVKKQMREYHVSQIRQSKTEHTSLRWLTEPKEWFKLQPHINDSEQCRTLSRTRAGIQAWETGVPTIWD